MILMEIVYSWKHQYNIMFDLMWKQKFTYINGHGSHSEESRVWETGKNTKCVSFQQ